MQTKEKTIFFVLVILSLFTRFFSLNYPMEVVFDETHFFTFIKYYNMKRYFFDIHPPLGKLTIAFMGWVSNFDFNNNQVSDIGNAYDSSVFWLRFIPALFGALLVPLVFSFIKKLSHSIRAATLGGIFVLFDNALLCQSRFILIDTQLIFFSILSLYSFFSFRKENEKSKKLLWLIITGLSCGVAVSIKWIGLGSLGIILLFLFIDWLKKKKVNLPSTVLLIKNLLLIILLTATVYIFSFYFHFKILNQTGPGNDFMVDEYKVGPEKENISFWKRFIYLNKQMYVQNLSITERHLSESKWYQWLFGQKPIYYWGKGNARIYLAGNPLVWIASSLAILLSLLYLVLKTKQLIPNLDFLLASYSFYLLPFIPIDRCLFLYHYFTALVIAIIVLSILLDKYLPDHKGKKVHCKECLKKEYPLIIIILIVLITSIYLIPITYGKEISPQKIENIRQILNFF